MTNDRLRELTTFRWTSSHLVRWCAAQQNWDKLHFDSAYLHDVAKLPKPLINGALKQQLLAQFLYEAFDGKAWPWRLRCRFLAPDFVDERLQARGRLVNRHRHSRLDYYEVEAEVWNLDRDFKSTEATAVVIADPTGEPVLSGPPPSAVPQAFRIDESVTPAASDVPARVREYVGHPARGVASCIPVDASRLRLFADALGCIRPLHYDPECAKQGPYGALTAPPLFPLHALELEPGGRPLSEDSASLGREGSAEPGSDLPELLELAPATILNGGVAVEVHSLAEAGEMVAATTQLVSAKVRAGSSGSLLLLDVLNRYGTSGGRSLLVERRTAVVR